MNGLRFPDDFHEVDDWGEHDNVAFMEGKVRVFLTKDYGCHGCLTMRAQFDSYERLLPHNR